MFYRSAKTLQFKHLKVPLELRRDHKFLSSLNDSEIENLVGDIRGRLKILDDFLYKLGSGCANRLAVNLQETFPADLFRIFSRNELSFFVSLARSIGDTNTSPYKKKENAAEILKDVPSYEDGIDDALDFISGKFQKQLKDCVVEYGYGFDSPNTVFQEISDDLGISVEDLKSVFNIFKGGLGVQPLIDDLKKMQRILDAVLALAEWAYASQVSKTYQDLNPPHVEEEADRVKAYHATVNLPALLSTGFRSDVEVKGLGGSTSGGKVSVTLSKNHAQRIAEGVKFAAMLARGEFDGKQLISWLESEGFLDEFMDWQLKSGGQFPNEKVEKLAGVSLEDQIDEAFKGIVYSFYRTWADKSRYEKALKNGGEVVWKDEDGYNVIVREKDKKKADDALYGMIQAIFYFMESKEIMFNPVFFEGTLENFRKIDPDKVGIVEVEFDPNANGVEYIPGEYEYRVPPEELEIVGTVSTF